MKNNKWTIVYRVHKWYVDSFHYIAYLHNDADSVNYWIKPFRFNPRRRYFPIDDGDIEKFVSISKLTISDERYTWRKSLTVYDSNCQDLAKLKKRCKSWNNDVELYITDANGNENMIAYTDYKTRVESTLDVYLANDTEQSVLRATFG